MIFVLCLIPHNLTKPKGDDKAAEKFKEVTEAYEVLSDDKQRELYDTYGHAGVDPNSGFGQQGGNPFGGGGPGGFDFGDGSFHFHSSGGPGGGRGGLLGPCWASTTSNKG